MSPTLIVTTSYVTGNVCINLPVNVCTVDVETFMGIYFCASVACSLRTMYAIYLLSSVTIMYSVLWTMLCFVEFTRRVDMSEQSTVTQQQQQQQHHDNYRILSELQHNSNHTTPP